VEILHLQVSLVAVERELAGQRGRAGVRVLAGCENLDLREPVGPVMEPAQVTEPLRGSREDSGLADDVGVPCQQCQAVPSRFPTSGMPPTPAAARLPCPPAANRTFPLE